MIEWFEKKRNGEGAQALIFTILISLLLISFIAFVVNAGRVISRKIKMQTAADASALSGAIWQARALNMIATLNVGISFCCLAIAGMVIAIGASLGKLIPVLMPYITKMYNIAKRMAKVQDVIKEANPIIVEGEVFRIAKVNGIKGAMAVAPELTPWPKLHIHRFGQPECFNPGTSWEIDGDRIDFHPSDRGINTIIPTPYIRDGDFDDKQYVFCIAVDEPAEIVAPGKRIFGVGNPVLLSLPEIEVAQYRLGGDIGYIAVAQAKPVNCIEPHPSLLVSEWDVELTPVTVFGDISVPGLKKIVGILEENLICH